MHSYRRRDWVLFAVSVVGYLLWLTTDGSWAGLGVLLLFGGLITLWAPRVRRSSQRDA